MGVLKAGARGHGAHRGPAPPLSLALPDGAGGGSKELNHPNVDRGGMQFTFFVVILVLGRCERAAGQVPLPPLSGTCCPAEYPLLHPGLSAGGGSDVAPHVHLETPNSFRKINIYRPLLDILIKDPLEFIPSQCCFDITESYKIRMLSQLLRSIH